MNFDPSNTNYGQNVLRQYHFDPNIQYRTNENKSTKNIFDSSNQLSRLYKSMKRFSIICALLCTFFCVTSFGTIKTSYYLVCVIAEIFRCVCSWVVVFNILFFKFQSLKRKFSAILFVSISIHFCDALGGYEFDEEVYRFFIPSFAMIFCFFVYTSGRDFLKTLSKSENVMDPMQVEKKHPNPYQVIQYPVGCQPQPVNYPYALNQLQHNLHNNQRSTNQYQKYSQTTVNPSQKLGNYESHISKKNTYVDNTMPQVHIPANVYNPPSFEEPHFNPSQRMNHYPQTIPNNGSNFANSNYNSNLPFRSQC
eukprot:TRINITY_DN2457_c0_g1_i1.p1 TRINITY_DN2457_c0_g1~~TRINITY_DN2457_c0_g1_i1.p1  ORF type:complete len:308 (+),score=55.12 TRINITY_DN2457_c0_g1_i1:146-1069(+)